MIEHQNFTIMSGTSRTLKIHATDEDGKDLLLTGCQIKWSMKGGTQAVEKSTPESITITDATAGLFEIKLLPTDTIGMRGDFYHECQITDPSGDVAPLFIGTAKIIKSGI